MRFNEIKDLVDVRLHYFALNRMARCVLYRYGQSPNQSNTVPYSPAVRRHLALRGCQSLRYIYTKEERLMVGENAIEAIKPHSRGTRPRRERIEVWVSIDEEKELDERADQAGLLNAAFLRAVGLNLPIGSRADLEAVRQLAKVDGDLGRIAEIVAR